MSHRLRSTLWKRKRNRLLENAFWMAQDGGDDGYRGHAAEELDLT